MTLFDFKLKPIEEVEPWGEPPKQSLHWFGLTDGFYSIDTGDQRLFEFSKKVIEEEKLTEPCLEYQVVRLYEDLLDILPYALAPLPEEIVSLIKSYDKQQEWQSQVNEIYNSTENENIENTCVNAMQWLENYQLATDFLISKPQIWIFSDKNTTYIRWNFGNSEI